MNQSYKNYWDKALPKLSVGDGLDKFSINKNAESDWAHLEWECNGRVQTLITIRSRESAAGLRFMLDQLLRGSE